MGPASNPSYRFAGEPGDDNFDRWNLNRDEAFLQENNYKYGPAWMPGLYDLSGDGYWQNDPIYGNVWEPIDVPDYQPRPQFAPQAAPQAAPQRGRERQPNG